MKNKNAYLQISFAWLFAFLVGAFILFLAIFAVTKIIKTSEIQIDAETAKEIKILLNPIETGFEQGTTNYIVLPSETKIYNKCHNSGVFGRQIISVSQKSFNKWTDTNIDVGFNNKYIFSESKVEGKKFYLFSKPFDFPFKVSDMIILTSASKEYCFTNAPKEIKEDIEEFQENLKIEDCSNESIKVCFNGNCDINVYYNKGQGYVEKQGERLYFTGNLIYSAIFADKEIYECQVKRLMQRTEQLSSLYKDKASLVAQKECNSDLNSELILLNNLAKSFSTSIDLNSITSIVEYIHKTNQEAICKLW